MAIDQRDYKYKVVTNDSLVVIAQKHGLSPAVSWARKIWEHENNKQMHTKANMFGREVYRQLHLGGNRYENYNHAKWEAGYRGYDDPHQIILYGNEEVYIPSEKNKTKIIKLPYSELMKKELEFETGIDYRIIVVMDDYPYSL